MFGRFASEVYGVIVLNDNLNADKFFKKYYNTIMKIIIGSESFAPNVSGVATVTEILANNLASAGHEVWVFAPSEKYKTYKDLKFDKFSVWRFNSIPNPFRKGFRVAVFSQQEIFRFVAQIQPDIIHLQDPTGICSQLLGAAQKYKIPVIVSNHFSLDYVTSYFRWLKFIHPQFKKILRWYLIKFYNHCQYVICPTETVKKELEKWGTRTKIIAISNGVDLDRFFEFSDLGDFYDKYHLPPNKKVLYIGRVDKDKGVEIFVRAIPKIAEATNAHFVIVGDGKELNNMKKLALKLHVDQKISWLGQIDAKSKEIIWAFQSAAVFVMPSKIETQSIATMEAMAAGLPIVGANGGALPELILDEKNGYLFEPDNSDDLALRVGQILSDRKKAKKMSEASLRQIARHEISISFKKIVAIYEELVTTK